MIYKNGERMRDFWGLFVFIIVKTAREAHSFPRATLSENCLLLGTDNVRGQIAYFRAKWRLLFIYPTRAHGIINNYSMSPRWK